MNAGAKNLVFNQSPDFANLQFCKFAESGEQRRQNEPTRLVLDGPV